MHDVIALHGHKGCQNPQPVQFSSGFILSVLINHAWLRYVSCQSHIDEYARLLYRYWDY